MDFFTPINIKKLPAAITYQDRILLVGSCFTEHIGNSLSEIKFRILQNPNGILFDPLSVCRSLSSYIEPRVYRKEDLFYLNETWSSWAHHSRFSGIDAESVLKKINESQKEAHLFLRNAEWLIMTLGSSFSYQLTETSKDDAGRPVANCHRAPAQWFEKHLLEVRETVDCLEDCTAKLREFNPGLKILYTISPVRHLRDGVVANNRSKARLIESVHHMIEKHDHQYYFPAYELVIDVLRDYRFYDIDLAHPNYAATKFVLERFAEACIEETSRNLMEEVRSIVTARKHRAFHPDTHAHKEFVAAQLRKAVALREQYPFLDLEEEIGFFSRT